ncbi:MAG: hypothetical protein AAF004_05305 [Pseudomonadota bacterium]
MQQFKNERKPCSRWSTGKRYDRKTRFAQALLRAKLVVVSVLGIALLPVVDATACPTIASPSSVGALRVCAAAPPGLSTTSPATPVSGVAQPLSTADRIARGTVILLALSSLVISRCRSVTKARWSS